MYINLQTLFMIIVFMNIYFQYSRTDGSYCLLLAPQLDPSQWPAVIQQSPIIQRPAGVPDVIQQSAGVPAVIQQPVGVPAVIQRPAGVPTVIQQPAVISTVQPAVIKQPPAAHILPTSVVGQPCCLLSCAAAWHRHQVHNTRYIFMRGNRKFILFIIIIFENLSCRILRKIGACKSFFQ